MFASHVARRFALPLVLAAATFAGACKDSTANEEEAEPEVATMRLTVTGQAPVSVSSNGTVTGGPLRISLGQSVITATWLRADGSADPHVSTTEFQLKVTVPATITGLAFSRSATNPFSGSLSAQAAGTVNAQFSLLHVEENHEDFGPFTVPVVITN